MFTDSNAFRTTSMIFILVTILVFLIKPKIFFSQEGQIKAFGIHSNEHETPLTLVMFIYGLMIVIYLLLLYLDSSFLHK